MVGGDQHFWLYSLFITEHHWFAGIGYGHRGYYICLAHCLDIFPYINHRDHQVGQLTNLIFASKNVWELMLRGTQYGDKWWLYLFCDNFWQQETCLQGYEMVSFDTVSVPPPVEDPDDKKEVESS